MKYVVVDAFTERKFAGNSAAVCLVEGHLSDALMQQVAAEFNLSETAYLALQSDGCWSLRWFTPMIEVNLCGHATLAAAHVLWTEFGVNDEVLRFATRSGELRVSRTGAVISMRFPITVTVNSDTTDWAQTIVKPALLSGAAIAGEDYLVELNDAMAVQNFTPDLPAIAALNSRGLIVSAKGAQGSGLDFVSRFFAPNAGIDEDPVTGSAHCALAHYWAQKLAKTDFVAKQVSRRGGVLGVAIDGDIVVLSGKAISTMRGELRLG